MEAIKRSNLSREVPHDMKKIGRNVEKISCVRIRGMKLGVSVVS